MRMIFSRWLVSESAPTPIPSVSGAGSDQPSDSAGQYLVRWKSDPGRSQSAAREPFDRLQFWRVSHELRTRLAPYEATGSRSTFRTSSWQTLRYWQLLLDEDDAGLIEMTGFSQELPDPTEWFARVR